MIESNAQFRASSRSNPHAMRRASLRTHSTDTRQTAQPILPTPSLSTQMRRPRPRSFSFDEQLSIIDDDDESVAHDMPFSVAPVRPFQAQQQQQQNQVQHRRLNTSKVSSRCRTRRRRSRSLTKRTNTRPTHPQQQQQQQQKQHEWLHTTENHHESTSSEEIDEEDYDEDDNVGENQAHFSPRSTSTAANRPRNRKPILHASDFDRRLCEAPTMTTANEQENSSPINSENIQHHTSPVSQPSTEPDELNLIVYSTNTNDLLNATIIRRKSETKKLSSHEKFLTIRYGSPDSGISGKT
jgi:hypothetical protein